tara:strand:- start:449 stop:631 length:183 start_codon:yes stop_codon:yes gene_type:complete
MGKFDVNETVAEAKKRKEIEDKIKKNLKQIEALKKLRNKFIIRAKKGNTVSPGGGKSRRS